MTHRRADRGWVERRAPLRVVATPDFGLVAACCVRCGHMLRPGEAERDGRGEGWECADRAACAKRIEERSNG